MPELPEMETYRRLLNDKIAGKTITQVGINREKSLNVPVNLFIERVLGKVVNRIERRAKHLIFHLDNKQVLLLHLMLGGWMFYGTEEDSPERTHQVILSFGHESLYFIGLRLGYLHVYTTEEIETRLADLGPEPLSTDFTLEYFQHAISRKRGFLKPVLVDQKLISGIGNCYSDEICFDAGILPTHKITELSEAALHNLYQSIRTVLNEAVHYGGYMEAALYKGDDLTGGFDERCKVYDREGEKCVRCGQMIVKDEITSRKTFYCMNCQH